MVTFANRVRVTTATTGTGNVTLGSAVSGYQTFAGAGILDGESVRYVIEDGSNWEVGSGIYTASGTTLSRSVDESSNGGAPISLSGSASLFVTVAASDVLNKAGDTMTGALTLPADPTTSLQAVTKQYVDTIASAGIHYHDPVRVEREGNLVATYNNGTNGVGATLTNSATQAALVIDGITLNSADRVLVYEQTDATQNGVYTVTDTGSASTNWVLTRATDADSYAPSDPDSLGQGDAFFVKEGSSGAGETYVMNTEGTITFGTTDITFVQFSSAQIYSAGTNMDLTGVVFSTVDSPTFTNVTAAGGTMTGDLSFGDTNKALFGAGSDLQIYHDGSNSVIADTGPGALFQYGSAIIFQKNGSNDRMADMEQNGAVRLFYDGSQKISTTSTGIDVTGKITADEELVIESASAYGRIEVGGPSGAFIDLKSPNSDDYDGRIITTGSGLQITTSGDSAVDIQHNNSTKLGTTATGINVTGNITVTGTVDGRDIATNIPASLGTAGQVLTVNAGATAGEWADVASGGTSNGFVYFMRG